MSAVLSLALLATSLAVPSAEVKADDPQEVTAASGTVIVNALTYPATQNGGTFDYFLLQGNIGSSDKDSLKGKLELDVETHSGSARHVIYTVYMTSDCDRTISAEVEDANSHNITMDGSTDYELQAGVEKKVEIGFTVPADKGGWDKLGILFQLGWRAGEDGSLQNTVNTIVVRSAPASEAVLLKDGTMSSWGGTGTGSHVSYIFEGNRGTQPDSSWVKTQFTISEGQRVPGTRYVYRAYITSENERTITVKTGENKWVFKADSTERMVEVEYVLPQNWESGWGTVDFDVLTGCHDGEAQNEDDVFTISSVPENEFEELDVRGLQVSASYAENTAGAAAGTAENFVLYAKDIGEQPGFGDGSRQCKGILRFAVAPDTAYVYRAVVNSDIARDIVLHLEGDQFFDQNTNLSLEAGVDKEIDIKFKTKADQTYVEIQYCYGWGGAGHTEDAGRKHAENFIHVTSDVESPERSPLPGKALDVSGASLSVATPASGAEEAVKGEGSDFTLIGKKLFADDEGSQSTWTNQGLLEISGVQQNTSYVYRAYMTSDIARKITVQVKEKSGSELGKKESFELPANKETQFELEFTTGLITDLQIQICHGALAEEKDALRDKVNIIHITAEPSAGMATGQTLLDVRDGSLSIVNHVDGDGTYPAKVTGTGEDFTLYTNCIGWSDDWWGGSYECEGKLSVDGLTPGQGYVYRARLTSDRDRKIKIEISGLATAVTLKAGVETPVRIPFTPQAESVDVKFEFGYWTEEGPALKGKANTIRVRADALDLEGAQISASAGVTAQPKDGFGGADFDIEVSDIGNNASETKYVTLTVDAVPNTEYIYAEWLKADTNRTIYAKAGDGEKEKLQLRANWPTEYRTRVYADDSGKVQITYYLGHVGESSDNVNSASRVNIAKKMQEKIILSNLKVERSRDSLTLSWDQVSDVTQYEIFRAEGRYAQYQSIGTVGQGASSYQDASIDTSKSVYTYYYKIKCTYTDGATEESRVISMDQMLFGDQMTFFSPADDREKIRQAASDIAGEMVPAGTAEFTDARYGLFFKPGDYSGIDRVEVGFYTQLAGLGETPDAVKIPGVYVDGGVNGNSLINFWRSVENLYVTGNVDWAASQAAPLRRLHVGGELNLDDGKEASGGFLADSKVDGQTTAWSQQQFFIRNCSLAGGCRGGVWNMVFVGTENAPANTENWMDTSYQACTVVERTGKIREKPFLYIGNDGEYYVYVPNVADNTRGISWSDGLDPSAGESIKVTEENFFIAKPGTSAGEINAALASGKNLLLTPGVYEADEPIKITQSDTLVLGLGMASFRVLNSEQGLQVADHLSNVVIAGVLFDAGEPEDGQDATKQLLQVGTGTAGISMLSEGNQPILLADIFCRVGGKEGIKGCADVSVEVNSDQVLGDHFWLWRADHPWDDEGYVGWNLNKGKNGLKVNGNDFNMYGLFVEHYQEYQTLWNGHGGTLYFYQSELPYDVPTQSDWMAGETQGYASYKVNGSGHKAYGLGVYPIFNHTQEYITLESAVEVPDDAQVVHACIVYLGGPTGNGGVEHVVNGQGLGVSSKGTNSSGDDGTGQKVGVNQLVTDQKVLWANLQQLITECEAAGYKKENYIEDVWDAYEAALAAAKRVVQTADMKTIALAESALRSAQKDLLLHPLERTEKKGVGSWYYMSTGFSDGDKSTLGSLGVTTDTDQIDPAVLAKAGVTWTYNWGLSEQTADLAGAAKDAGIEFVPMFWNGAMATEDNFQRIKEGVQEGLYQHVLTFNEPNLSNEANMSVDDAITAYGKIYEALKDVEGLKLGSPAGANADSPLLDASGNEQWVYSFMTKAKAKGYRVDFINIHVYQDVTDPNSVDYLKQTLEKIYKQWNLPIWITEIGAVDVSTQWAGYSLYNVMSHGETAAYMRKLIPMLESLDCVERYAWFVDYSSNTSGTDYTRLFDPAAGKLTSEGICYASLAKEKDSEETDKKPTITEKKPSQSKTDAAAPVIDKAKTGIANSAGKVKKKYAYMEEVILSVSAKSPDGGTLSYQWYKNSKDSKEGAAIIDGAVKAEYTAPTDSIGQTWYFCKVTNTLASADGNQTAAAFTDHMKLWVVKAENPIAGISAYCRKIGSQITLRPEGEATYKSSNPSLVKVSKKGKVTFKDYGIATVTVNAKGNEYYKAAKVKLKFTVKPKKAKVESVKSAKSGMAAVTWKADRTVSGYEVQYAYRQDFRDAKKMTVKKNTVTSATLTGLKGNKKIYVRVREYKKVGEKKIYGSWSDAVSVKTKK